MKKIIACLFCLIKLSITNGFAQTGNPYWDARIETSKQEQKENNKILAKGNKAYKKQEEENKKKVKKGNENFYSSKLKYKKITKKKRRKKKAIKGLF